MRVSTPVSEMDTSLLTRIIRDVLQQDPPSALPNLTSRELVVTRRLTVEDQIAFSKDPDFHNVGGTGEAVFKNSWVDFGGGPPPTYGPSGYWKDPLGFVHLRGLIKSGTVGNAAFTLPPGLRPSATVVAVAISNDALGRVNITTGGDVIPVSPSSNTWVSLFGIYFKV